MTAFGRVSVLGASIVGILSTSQKPGLESRLSGRPRLSVFSCVFLFCRASLVCFAFGCSFIQLLAVTRDRPSVLNGAGCLGFVSVCAWLDGNLRVLWDDDANARRRWLVCR